MSTATPPTLPSPSSIKMTRSYLSHPKKASSHHPQRIMQRSKERERGNNKKSSLRQNFLSPVSSVEEAAYGCYNMTRSISGESGDDVSTVLSEQEPTVISASTFSSSSTTEPDLTNFESCTQQSWTGVWQQPCLASHEDEDDSSVNMMASIRTLSREAQQHYKTASMGVLFSKKPKISFATSLPNKKDGSLQTLRQTWNAFQESLVFWNATESTLNDTDTMTQQDKTTTETKSINIQSCHDSFIVSEDLLEGVAEGWCSTNHSQQTTSLPNSLPSCLEASDLASQRHYTSTPLKRHDSKSRESSMLSSGVNSLMDGELSLAIREPSERLSHPGSSTSMAAESLLCQNSPFPDKETLCEAQINPVLTQDVDDIAFASVLDYPDDENSLTRRESIDGMRRCVSEGSKMSFPHDEEPTRRRVGSGVSADDSSIFSGLTMSTNKRSWKNQRS